MLQVILNGLSVSSLYALAAVGVTLIFGVLRIINFAHGETATLASYTVFFTASTLGISTVAGGLLGLAVTAVVALVIFEVVIRRVLKAPHLNQIVATLGVALTIEGAVLLYFGGDPHAVSNGFTRSSLALGSASISSPRALGIAVAAVLLAALGLMLTRTEFGRRVRAVAQDAEVAELMGINTVAIQRAVFVLGSMLAGVSGVFLVMSAYIVPTSGVTTTLTAYAIVIIGGVGRPLGALVGALLFGLGEAFVGAYVPSGTAWIAAVPFVIIIVTAVLRPGGIRAA